jgi:hypothetical protein
VNDPNKCGALVAQSRAKVQNGTPGAAPVKAVPRTVPARKAVPAKK